MEKPQRKRKFDEALSTSIDIDYGSAAKRKPSTITPKYSYDTTLAIDRIADNGYGYGSEESVKGADDFPDLRDISTHWNDQFQAACESPAVTPQERLQRLAALVKLYEAFVARATEIGKVIIEEMQIASSYKTVMRYTNRGIAGGEKFCCDGIFFKLAVDTYNLYGGDCFSMKAAGHEILALNELVTCNVKGLHFPIMMIMDYYGYRLVAETALPISPKTLCYGSDDGCKIIHDDNETLRLLARKIANKLNLKEHIVGYGLAAEPKALWLPGDVEGHVGRDNRLYLVDVQRLFPAEDAFAFMTGVKIPYKDDQNLEIVRLDRQQLEVEISKVLGEDTDWIETQFAEAMVILYHGDHPARSPWKVLPTYRKEDDRLKGYTADSLLEPKQAVNAFPLRYPSRNKNPEKYNRRASILVDHEVYGDAIVVSGSKREVLYYMLRPELLRESAVPISSDVFTKFGQHNKEIHEAEVRELTRKLREEKIPQFAAMLLRHPEKVPSSFHLPTLLHSHGINLRYIGLLYTILHQDFPPTHANLRLRENIIGFQMLARIIKNLLLAKLRARKFDSEENFKEVVVRFFNVVLGDGQATEQFWNCIIPIHILLKYAPFGFGLNVHELNLRKILGKYKLFKLLQEFTGVKFKPESSAKFRNRSNTCDLTSSLDSSDSSRPSLSASTASCVNSAEPLSVDDLETIQVKIKSVDMRQSLGRIIGEIYDCVLEKIELEPPNAQTDGTWLAESQVSESISSLSLGQNAPTLPFARATSSQPVYVLFNKIPAPQFADVQRIVEILSSYNTLTQHNILKYQQMITTTSEAMLMSRLNMKKQVFNVILGNDTLRSNCNLLASASLKLADVYSQLGYHRECAKCFAFTFTSILNHEVYMEIVLGLFYLIGIALERLGAVMQAAKHYCVILRWMEELMDSENDICSATPFEVELHSRLLRAFEIAGDVNRAQYHRSKLKQLSTIFTETIFGYDHVWSYLSFSNLSGLKVTLPACINPEALQLLYNLEESFAKEDGYVDGNKCV